MNNWADKLINKLNLDGAFVYLLDDPDGLCFEPHIAAFFNGKQATLVDDADPLVLRLSFEQWHKEPSTAALLIRIVDEHTQPVPYDIAQTARKVSFNLAEICAEIDAHSLRQIPAMFYQTVVDAIEVYRPGKLTPQASTDFILRHVYKIAPEVIQNHIDVVRLLIRKHYIGIEMPLHFEQRLITLLTLNPALRDWDFTALVLNKSLFFTFLQQQWAFYILSLRPETQIRNTLFNRDELVVPFDDADIRLLIDNLFADGVLLPIVLEVNDLPAGHWASLGIETPDNNAKFERCKRLLNQTKTVFELLDTSILTHEFWAEQSHSLGVLNALFYQLTTDDAEPFELNFLKDNITHINLTVDAIFESWLLTNFGALQSLPTIKVPVMVHKVPSWLANKLASNKKVCLLVLDGLGARQWPLLRNLLQARAAMLVEEHSCFAWVPTITSISRQALFSGKRPFAFADSLLTTSKEETLWRDFWADHGLARHQVLYAKNAERLSQEEWQNLIHPSALKVAGIVINFIDDQMHGMKAGMAGLNKMVDLWLQQWGFIEKIEALLSQGFEIVLTADHGSQEALGVGGISDGVKAETRGERVRIYNTQNTQLSTATTRAETMVVWPGPSFGLPQNCFPILAKGSHAFKPKGENVVGHGGISLHEVVVPLAVITSKPIQYE
ncbi:BREX-3 system phosphatase PglZ [Shewanella sp. SM87]|uniref:BREX-3 system phosphatase PglZ n=1 Tax=Shewanella sp. SM87 TaxID=2912808 RepID=UPI0021D8AFF0|nr:BREX-3 system phosphatase PglZ [Shewanella sp. SM87]MCU8007341.1 BREX-3 system phosphatase PglZ [Shewanella sp. SM87]